MGSQSYLFRLVHVYPMLLVDSASVPRCRAPRKGCWLRFVLVHCVPLPPPKSAESLSPVAFSTRVDGAISIYIYIYALVIIYPASRLAGARQGMR